MPVTRRNAKLDKAARADPTYLSMLMGFWLLVIFCLWN